MSLEVVGSKSESELTFHSEPSGRSGWGALVGLGRMNPSDVGERIANLTRWQPTLESPTITLNCGKGRHGCNLIDEVDS
jgi:hypothetical protein